MSISTPRETIPCFALVMPSRVHPAVESTDVREKPLYMTPSRELWQSASMWLWA
ncbi:MAG: hypothetical protein OEN00_05375 [Gemmatimonadota bacterium]|nr:hypothetical protein [Gemmatimonadota bacterium]